MGSWYPNAHYVLKLFALQAEFLDNLVELEINTISEGHLNDILKTLLRGRLSYAMTFRNVTCNKDLQNLPSSGELKKINSPSLCFISFLFDGHWEPCNKVGSLNPFTTFSLVSPKAPSLNIALRILLSNKPQLLQFNPT